MIIIIYERLDVFCINIGNTSASKELEQFVVVIMSLDLLASELPLQHFCECFIGSACIHVYAKNITQYFIQLPVL